MTKLDLIPTLVALIVAMGGGAGLLKFFEGIIKIRSGMSAKESARKVDIVKQRDEALTRESNAWKLVDAEAAKRRAAQEEEARLRRLCIVNGIDPGDELEFENTITKPQRDSLQNKEKS